MNIAITNTKKWIWKIIQKNKNKKAWWIAFQNCPNRVEIRDWSSHENGGVGFLRVVFPQEEMFANLEKKLKQKWNAKY
jgi:hypothetical protein